MDYLDVPCGTIDKYIDLLLMWNKKINLISVSSREELIERHILDSLQLMDYLTKDQNVFDIGSGAGFPGVMLSYAGVTNVSLVESNSKKCSFLTVASALSENNITVYNSQIEKLNIDNCDIITARGFAALEDIFSSTQHIKNAKYLVLKGKNVELEIKKALDKWKFKYIIHQSKTSAEGCVLEVEQLELNEQENYCGSESERWSR